MSLFYWKFCSIATYQISAFLMSLPWGKVLVVYCSCMCRRLNTFQLYILQIGHEVLWHVVLWTGTIYNRCWNFLLCLNAWMNFVKNKVILNSLETWAVPKQKSAVDQVIWNRRGLWVERTLRAGSEGGRRKALTGQVRGLVHWERSEITAWLGANLTFVQIHVHTHLHFSYVPSISEWCLKLRSITSPWEILLLKLSSQSTCLSFAHACLIRATWVPTSLNETGIGE